MADDPQLYSIAFSPWSNKVKWTLNACGVGYTRVEYTPGLSELNLRLKLRNYCGRVTVPVMAVPRGPVLVESFDIAVWTDDHREKGRPSLFPAGIEAAQEWNDLSDRILYVGRVQSLRKIISNTGAVWASMPGQMRRLGPLGRMLAKYMLTRLLAKYSGEFDETSEDKAWAAMEALRQALKKNASGKDGLRDAYIFGEFSYADIAMAMALEMVCPARGSLLARRKRTAQMCTWREAAKEFADVLEWRDAVVERHECWKRYEGA